MRRYLLIILLISLFSFSGCDDVLDCIVNVRPELHAKTLAIGYVDEYYSDTILPKLRMKYMIMIMIITLMFRVDYQKE